MLASFLLGFYVAIALVWIVGTYQKYDDRAARTEKILVGVFWIVAAIAIVAHKGVKKYLN